ncbi:MAG: flagellar basal body rod protein FlgC [Lachnospirales bacterium]
MGLLDSTSVIATGLTAQALRMDVISENIANINTTRTDDGTAYKRKTVIFEEKGSTSPFGLYFNEATGLTSDTRGVQVSKIVEDDSKGALMYDPSHPDANDEGYVQMPNVNIVEEMVNMISASRSYEANVTAMGATKAMVTKTLEIK